MNSVEERSGARSGERIEQVIDHVVRLPRGEQLAVLRTVAVRVLGRLGEPDREAFFAQLRRVPHPGAGAGPVPEQLEPPEKVARDVLDRPVEEQERILRTAAERVVAESTTVERERFIQDIAEAIAGMAPGQSAQI